MALRSCLDSYGWRSRHDLTVQFGDRISPQTAMREYLNTFKGAQKDQPMEDIDYDWAIWVGKGRIIRQALTSLKCERRGEGPDALYRLP